MFFGFFLARGNFLKEWEKLLKERESQGGLDNFWNNSDNHTLGEISKHLKVSKIISKQDYNKKIESTCIQFISIKNIGHKFVNT